MKKVQEDPNCQEEENLLNKEIKATKDYSEVMSESHPYYNIFKNKLDRLNAIFDPPATAASATPETSFPLKLYCYQEEKLNTFVYFFTFPTDVDTYDSISNDFDLQKKFDGNIESFQKQYEVVGGDAKLIYLSYKKVLMMSSRDF